MKDILLEASGDGYYDWQLNEDGTDLETVIGDQQLINAVRHRLLLEYHELEQVLYSDKGNSLKEYINVPNTEANKDMLVNEFVNEIRSVDGVFDADVEFNFDSGSLIIKKIIITKENGGTLQIGGGNIGI